MLILDPTYPEISYCDFKDKEGQEAFYGDVEEALPPNAPDPGGKSKSIVMRIVGTLLWEQVSGSTYVDHDQTVVTIAVTSSLVQ